MWYRLIWHKFTSVPEENLPPSSRQKQNICKWPNNARALEPTGLIFSKAQGWVKISFGIKYCMFLVFEVSIVPGCIASFMISKKGKAIPLQAWVGPECCRRLRLPDFKTIGTCRW